MPLPPKTRLGPYEIVAVLGAGGMGEVYRARDTRLERTVAIKILPESFSSDRERLERFQQEARILSALNHPNLMAIYDVGSQDGLYFLVSEFFEGQTLRERLEAGPLPQRRVNEYGLQIAKGLAAAHEQGVVHRDLKPENIFVLRDERVKILDFGLAKQAAIAAAADRTATSADRTAAGTVLGTAGYMSPEQVRGETVDHRSDIFSFGTILYEMVAGQRAFRGDSGVEVMNSILKQEPPDLAESGMHVSLGLQRIVQRCLEKKPNARFQSASDLAFNLEGLLGVPSTRAATVASAESHPSTRVMPLALGAVLLVLIAGGSWMLGRRTASAALPFYHQLTFERGLVYAGRFAPDGRSIYYSASWNGQPVQLYSTVPDSPESRSLNLLNSTLFAVSSSEIAISLGCKDRYIGNCQGTLGLVPVSGGSPREIVEDALSADWTADASEMGVIRQVQGKYRVEFPRGKVIYESVRPLGYLRISPHANAVAFMEVVNVEGDGGWVVAIDRSGKELIRSHYFISIEGVAWSPSGEEVWAGATVHQGWADAIHGFGFNGKERIVLRLPGMLRLHDVSRDGRILLSKESWRSGLQFRGVADAKERDLSWLDYATLRDLSADGRQVAFDDWGSAAGAFNLAYVRKTDGSPAIKLGGWTDPVLSPDGTRVFAVDASNTSSLSLALLPTGVGETQRLKSLTMQQVNALGFMPDGKAVYFAADNGRGWRMYVQDLAGGTPRSVTPLISLKPSHFETSLVSPDGRFVFARDLSGKGGLYPIAGGEPRGLPGWTPDDIWITWSADGHSAYVYHDDKTSALVYRLDLANGIGGDTISRRFGRSDFAV